MQKIQRYSLFFFLVLSIFITGCENPSNYKNPHEISSHTGRKQQILEKNKDPLFQITPLEVDSNTFQYIIGWISNEEILFNEYINGKTIISSFNIINGEEKVHLEIDNYLHSAEISPSQNYLLLHTSNTPYEAQLDIFETNHFVKVFESMIESREISYEWNPADESKLLVTAFFEDWSYKAYLLNAKEDSRQELSLPHPFAKWFNDRFLLLNWDKEHPSFQAPLITFDNRHVEQLFNGENFYYFDSWDNTFVGAKINQDDMNKAEWIFFDQNLQQISSFHIPHLARFSDWVIPYYDLSNDETQLLIIEPLESGEVDVYSGGFQLVLRNIQTGELEVVLDSIDNKPLLCSPNGTNCLFGHQFEKMILVEDKEILDFIVFKSKDR